MTPMDMYLDFVAERHRIWEQRQLNPGGGFETSDPILRTKKFTNVFRVLDYGSQFLLGDLLDTHERDEELFRSFLYRFTNRPDAWLWFNEEHGRWPLLADLDSGALLDSWERFDASGGKFFSGAYYIFATNPGKQPEGTVRRKFRGVIDLARNLEAVQEDFWDTESTEERVEILTTLPRVAGFMAQQITTDMAYVDCNVTENDWVSPGPGSLRGADWLMGSSAPFADVVEIAQEAVWSLRPEVGLRTPNGGWHRPTLMDIQNTLCEFDKYNRYLNSGKLPSVAYRPQHPGAQPAPVLPSHW